MRLLILFPISLALLAATPAQPKQDSTPSQAAPQKLSIPPAAVKGDDGLYRFTDSQGKKWVYRSTPFGVARWEDKPADAASKAADASAFNNVKATEDGDSIRFERPGPFGTYKWQRKKTELSDLERAAWERQKTRAAKPDSAAQDSAKQDSAKQE